MECANESKAQSFAPLLVHAAKTGIQHGRRVCQRQSMEEEQNKDKHNVEGREGERNICPTKCLWTAHSSPRHPRQSEQIITSTKTKTKNKTEMITAKLNECISRTEIQDTPPRHNRSRPRDETRTAQRMAHRTTWKCDMPCSTMTCRSSLAHSAHTESTNSTTYMRMYSAQRAGK